jgi:hypothetical protein
VGKLFYYYAKRFFHLGLRVALKRAFAVGRNNFFLWRHYLKFLVGFKGHAWSDVAKKFGIESQDLLWAAFRDKKVTQVFFSNSVFQQFLQQKFVDKSWLKIFCQNLVIKNRLMLFGQERELPQDHMLLWHCDFTVSGNKAKMPWYCTGKPEFFSKVKVPQHKPTSISEFFADIKVPWEVSRLQHLLVLGMAHNRLGKKYSEEMGLENYVRGKLVSWLDSNPFLLGVNWKNPMEVAIRAVNLLWICDLFDFGKKPSSLRARLTCSLFDHMDYIDSYWEDSVTPNNHFLADLIGFSYLKVFFSKQLCLQEGKFWKHVFQAFGRQLSVDGASYEGSTAYHALVSEFLLHFFVLSKKFYLVELSDLKVLEKKLCLALRVFQNTSFFLRGENVVKVGDDDSGILCFGLEKKPENTVLTSQKKIESFKFFENQGFGLITARYEQSFFSLRGGRLPVGSPSGHLHGDGLSVTAIIEGDPLLLDPGTGCYSANRLLRDRLRSEVSHTTFGLQRPLRSGLEMFEFLPVSVFNDRLRVKRSPNGFCLQVRSFEEGLTGNPLDVLTKNREVLVDYRLQKFDRLSIVDSAWGGSKSLDLFFSYVFAPGVFLEQKSKTCWILKQNKKMFKLQSFLPLKKERAFFSRGYLQAQLCEKLTFQGSVSCSGFLQKLEIKKKF